MKQTIILLTGILFSLSTFAQRIALNKVVGFEIPKDLHVITREQALAHASEKFRGNKMALEFYAGIDTSNERLYKVDDIIIDLKSPDTTFDFKAGYATHTKKALDEAARRAENYTSSLKTINNNAVVITYSIIGDTGYCFFFCFNANNTRTISGRVVFAKADKDKVTAILDPILNSIKFKD